MSDNLPITLPCTILIGDLSFDVEATVEYNKIGSLIAIEKLCVNGEPVQLSQEQYEQLSEELSFLYEEDK